MEGLVDLDTVADELYGLSPADFTAARDERAKAARAAGDRHLAEQIRRLRRPTLAAWASNLLVRERPEETGALLELGEALRRAHQDLDGEQLRDLSDRQRRVISALALQAGLLAAEAGQRISEDARREVEETLQNALADPDTAREWARGRLARPLTAPLGFTAVTVAHQALDAPRPQEAAGGRVADLDAARARRREQREQLERARRQAADAERELHDREDDLAAAHDAQRRAEEHRRQAEQRVAELTQRLEKAEDEHREARDAARQARDQAREADRAVRRSRRQAQEATAHVRQLTQRTRPRPAATRGTPPEEDG
jgi:hypothetical protein